MKSDERGSFSAGFKIMSSKTPGRYPGADISQQKVRRVKLTKEFLEKLGATALGTRITEPDEPYERSEVLFLEIQGVRFRFWAQDGGWVVSFPSHRLESVNTLEELLVTVYREGGKAGANDLRKDLKRLMEYAQ